MCEATYKKALFQRLDYFVLQRSRLNDETLDASILLRTHFLRISTINRLNVTLLIGRIKKIDVLLTVFINLPVFTEKKYYGQLLTLIVYMNLATQPCFN